MRYREVHALGRAHRVAREPALQVLLEVEREFRLRAIALEDLVNRLDPRERPVEHLRANPARQRLGPQLGQPLIEWRNRHHRRNRRHILRDDWTNPAERGRNDRTEEQGAAHG